MSRCKRFLVLFLSLFPLLSLIINHYSRCGFGKDSVFWYVCHLAPQSTPQWIFPFGSLSLSGVHLQTHWRSWQCKHTQVSAWKGWSTCNKRLSCALTLQKCSQVRIQCIPNHLSCIMPCDEFWAKMSFFGMTSVELNCLSGSVSSSLHFFSQTFKLNPAH